MSAVSELQAQLYAVKVAKADKEVTAANNPSDFTLEDRDTGKNSKPLTVSWDSKGVHHSEDFTSSPHWTVLEGPFKFWTNGGTLQHTSPTTLQHTSLTGNALNASTLQTMIIKFDPEAVRTSGESSITPVVFFHNTSVLEYPERQITSGSFIVEAVHSTNADTSQHQPSMTGATTFVELKDTVTGVELLVKSDSPLSEEFCGQKGETDQGVHDFCRAEKTWLEPVPTDTNPTDKRSTAGHPLLCAYRSISVCDIDKDTGYVFVYKQLPPDETQAKQGGWKAWR